MILLRRDDIYYCDDISAPFILGIINPRIYSPFDMAKQDMKYVLAHEETSVTYYFNEVFVFDAEKSSEVESYRFDTPVVNGTVFREKE